MLRQCSDSTLASRGVFLIRSLLKGKQQHRAKRDSTTGSPDTLAWPLESRGEIDALCTTEAVEAAPGEVPPRDQTELAPDERPQVADGDDRIPEEPRLPPAMDLDLTDEMSWFNMLDYFPSATGAQQNFALESLFKEMFPQ